METKSWFENVKMLHVNGVGLEWFDFLFKTTGFGIERNQK